MIQDFKNEQVLDYLERYEQAKTEAPAAFVALLSKGFPELKGCRFFDWTFTEAVHVVLGDGLPPRPSYYEYVTNKTYVDQFVEDGQFSAAFACLDELTRVWNDVVKLDVDLVVLLQVGGPCGDAAALSFYLARDGDAVFTESVISNITNPAVLRRIRY